MPETTAWLAARPLPELLELSHHLSPRERRLFGAACLRRATAWAAHPSLPDVIAACERAADSPGDERALEWARELGFAFAPDDSDFDDPYCLANLGRAVDELLGDDPDPAAVAAACRYSLDPYPCSSGEQWFQADLFRCVAGNPFRPVAFAAEWRTPDAVGLARGAYRRRDFDALPYLADALEDAGCDAAGLLAHCRDGTLSHARGCWAVDLVLGLR